MEKRKTYFIVTVLFLLYIAAVLCLCLLNLSDKTPELPEYFLGIPMDKIAHFLMYFAYPPLCWLMLTYNRRLKINPRHVFSTIFITGILFAAFTETAQGFLTTYRDPDPMDFVANITGICCATLLMWAFRKPATKVCNRVQEYMHGKLHK